jgi:hypothetical protein
VLLPVSSDLVVIVVIRFRPQLQIRNIWQLVLVHSGARLGSSNKRIMGSVPSSDDKWQRVRDVLTEAGETYGYKHLDPAAEIKRLLPDCERITLMNSKLGS